MEGQLRGQEGSRPWVGTEEEMASLGGTQPGRPLVTLGKACAYLGGETPLMQLRQGQWDPRKPGADGSRRYLEHLTFPFPGDRAPGSTPVKKSSCI